ncbi:MAG TPA: ammonium transporter [Actinomycetes bacterium]|nr:ammonium transporter [Actinomycetes bacterium]
MNTGDTAWVLAASALVMLMLPGLGLFYGGMVRAKNVLSTVVQSFFALGIVSLLWVLIGYTLAFGGDAFGGLIGNLEFLGFRHVDQGVYPYAAQTVPQLAFAAFQLMFAVITPALITGAFAERIKFSGYVAFTALWLVLVYAPVAHWVFMPEGWAFKLGALDFAGGTVVHMNSGAAALAIVLVIGRRRGFRKEPVIPHNLTLTVLGAGLLWFGWFGFNAGSAVAANGVAANAFLVTQVAAGCGAIGWALVDVVRERKATTLGMASGAVAGLVAITPCAGFVGPLDSIAIGLIAGVVCALAVGLKFRFGFDDALDVVGVHFVGGLAGALMVGIFAQKIINPAGADGLLAGGGVTLLGKQALAAAAVAAFSFTASFLLAKLVDVTVGLRVSAEDELTGLDLSQHAEQSYALTEGGFAAAPADHAVAAARPAPTATVPQGGEA